MNKFWGLVFLLIPVGSVALFVYAAYAPPPNWWLPKDISTHGAGIDHLFMVILWITGVTFVLTQAVLCYFLFRYSGNEPEKPLFIHTHHKAEIVWTIIPAVILVFIAFYQFKTWKQVKFTDNFPPTDLTVEVLAGQFEWRITYPGEDKKLGTRDDITSVNDFHVPVGKPVTVHLKSRDVIHSFFLPNLRLKQDALPGMTIPLWFQPQETGKFDLVCAELCGWGHYKMRGRLTVETEANFKNWLKAMKEEQEVSK